MKKIFFILPVLFACKSYQNKDYYVERYPDFWEDTIVLENGHWHFCDNNKWTCIETNADTLIFSVHDTIEVKNYFK